jgi:hypothetical protein
MKQKVCLIIVIVLLALINMPIVSAQVEPPVVYEMDNKVTFSVLENGDAQVKEVISLSAAGFIEFRKQYPMLSMLARLFKPKNIPLQIENLKIDIDETNNKITATYIIKGASINKRDYWELIVASEGEKVTLSAQTGNTLVFTFTGPVGVGFRIITTSTVILPLDAKNIKFDETTNKIRYELPQKAAPMIFTSNIIFLVIAGIAIILAIVNYVLKRKAT